MSHKEKITDLDPLFVIDPATREITNESTNERKTLIQYDHNSERFTFLLPRYIENHDMKECNRVEVHYLTTSGNTGVYEVSDLAVYNEDESKLICTWLISQNATADTGVLSFLVRFACVAEDGTIEYVWNTAIYAGVNVQRGLYNSNDIDPQYVDIIAQWYDRLFSMSDEGVNNIYTAKNEALAELETAKNTAKDDIEAKGVSVSESLPDDYTDLSNQVNKLNNADYDLNNIDLWEQGYINSSGDKGSSSAIRTKDYLSKDVKVIYAENGFTFHLACYENGTFVGYYRITNGAVSTSEGTDKNRYINVGELSKYQVRVIMYKPSNFSDGITPSNYTNIHFFNENYIRAFCQTPTLTFIDDDGSANALENWESITDEIGINITSAINTGTVGDATHVTWDEVERLQNKGYEFISHTHNHIKLTETNEETIIADLSASVNALKEHNCESRYLVYPFNAINATTMPLVKKYFKAGVGLGTERFNTFPTYTYEIRRVSINEPSIYVDKEYNGETVSVYAFRSLDYLKDYIDRALVSGSWVIVMTHLRNDGTNFYYDNESRQLIIDLCKYATQKGMVIQTFGEAFKKFKNRMETPYTESVYASNFHIVDCNGVAHIRKTEVTNE